MRLPVVGFALIMVAVSVGFICVDEATWQTYRTIFPAGAGLAIGLGLVLVFWPSFSQ